MTKQTITLLSVIILLIGCGKASTQPSTDNTSKNTPNILFIIADDLGKDAIAGYPEGTTKPTTPHIDELRKAGLTFNNLWVYPTCTPTRASIITGKYGYRTGIKWVDDELNSSEKILQKLIKEKTNNKYATAIVGKWHLSANKKTINPESFGLDYYAGIFTGAVKDYYNWSLTEDTTTKSSSEYTTKKLTDLAIDWIKNQNKPWFMWLAYNAPHTPFHVPPQEMHSQGNLPNYTTGSEPLPYYLAAIEAMDYQIGKLLDSIPNEKKENLVIIFIGDNGSPQSVAQSPYSRTKSKSSLYQGGINTPMFVSGSGVSRIGTDDNLISSTDLYATIAEIAGISIKTINDSKSFKSLFSSNTKIRNFQHSEMNDQKTDAWTISNGKYKLIVNSNGNQELYDLVNDPYEQKNISSNGLTTTEEAKKILEAELLKIRS